MEGLTLIKQFQGFQAEWEGGGRGSKGMVEMGEYRVTRGICN